MIHTLQKHSFKCCQRVVPYVNESFVGITDKWHWNKIKWKKKKKIHFENWAMMPHLFLIVKYFKLSWVKQRDLAFYSQLQHKLNTCLKLSHVLSIVYHFNVFFLFVFYFETLIVQTCLFAFATNYIAIIFCKSKLCQSCQVKLRMTRHNFFSLPCFGALSPLPADLIITWLKGYVDFIIFILTCLFFRSFTFEYWSSAIKCKTISHNKS